MEALNNFFSKAAKYSTEHIKKEPLKGTIIIAAVTYTIFRAFSQNSSKSTIIDGRIISHNPKNVPFFDV